MLLLLLLLPPPAVPILLHVCCPSCRPRHRCVTQSVHSNALLRDHHCCCRCVMQYTAMRCSGNKSAGGKQSGGDSGRGGTPGSNTCAWEGVGRQQKQSGQQAQKRLRLMGRTGGSPDCLSGRLPQWHHTTAQGLVQHGSNLPQVACNAASQPAPTLPPSTHLLAAEPAGLQLLEELHVQQVKAVLGVAVKHLLRRDEARAGWELWRHTRGWLPPACKSIASG